MTISKNITLPDDLVDYIRRENLNLSRFVQEKLRERINGGIRSLDTIKGILSTSNYNEWEKHDSNVTEKSKCRDCKDYCNGFFREELIYKKDVLLRLEVENDCKIEQVSQLMKNIKFNEGFGRDEETRKKIKEVHNVTFNWAADFHDPWYSVKIVNVFYGNSKIDRHQAISCDGGRITIVPPQLFKKGENNSERKRAKFSATDEDSIPLFIRPNDYNISKIISQLNPMQFGAKFPRRIQIG